MVKITYLGAGSMFAYELAKDIFQIPGINKGELCLVDIDAKRLGLSVKTAKIMCDRLGAKWKITASTDRRKVMKGSDYIINSIEVSGVQTVKFDYEIPLKYGIDQCIGDTIGPGGIMKALRTIPAWLEILKDVEELCPKAFVMNYTNPMSMMMLAAFKSTQLRQMVGLCHSVQGTSKNLADYSDVLYEELEWECAGINHVAWITKLGHRGKDIYPMLKEKARKDKKLYYRDPVRFEVMLQLGYFVTESSGHFSEYCPYFRKRPDLIKKYCRENYNGGSGFYSKMWPKRRKELDKIRARIISGKQEVPLARSHEFASQIIEAKENNKPTIIHGSVLNTGLITNLPQNQVVEVACLIDRNGITPTYYGELPPQLAAIDKSNMAVYELAVKAILENSYETAVHALMLDPLTAAVCSFAEIRKLFGELYKAEKDFIPKLK